MYLSPSLVLKHDKYPHRNRRFKLESIRAAYNRVYRTRQRKLDQQFLLQQRSARLKDRLQQGDEIAFRLAGGVNASHADAEQVTQLTALIAQLQQENENLNRTGARKDKRIL